MEKILIADDNLQITRILSEFVKKEGYAPVVAEDGETALRLFQADLSIDTLFISMESASVTISGRRLHADGDSNGQRGLRPPHPRGRSARRAAQPPPNPFRCRSPATYPSGTGLGLSIAREIALRHHVDMTCDSVPGAGTRFTLTFRDEA